MSVYEWPDWVGKPDLPVGYRWSCLAPAKGLRLPDGSHPWWIRVVFYYNHKRLGVCSRYVKIRPEFFDSPVQAVAAAVEAVAAHKKKREKNDLR